MRRIKLRQRGFRNHGTPYTGENVNKTAVETVEAPKVTKKRTTKKKATSIVSKLIKDIIG